MSCMVSSRRSFWTFAVVVALFIILVFFSSQLGWNVGIFAPYSTRIVSNLTKISVEDPFKLECPNVLEMMTEGRWKKRPHTQQEFEKIESFYYKIREHHSLPKTLQREDKKCGNSPFSELNGRTPNALAFRALCDRYGDTPCCYENRCVAKSEEQCKCPECYDLRQRIDAEFANWIPSTSRCKMREFDTKDQTCDILNNMTIYFIGDSLVRHIYTSLLSRLRGDKYYGPLRKETPQDKIQECDSDFVYYSMCRLHVDRDVRECNNTVHLKSLEYFKISSYGETEAAIHKLQNKPNSMVFIGIGIHDSFDFRKLVNEFLNPLKRFLAKSSWPKAVWLSTHSVGLLKSPRLIGHTPENIYRFNSIIKSAIDNQMIVLDFFNLTKDVFSFDGAHYGKGVNNVKSQIILNYIQQLRTA